MATYNTLPTVSEDALINEPKAPQNRKAIAIVAAVCFARAPGAVNIRPHLQAKHRGVGAQLSRLDHASRSADTSRCAVNSGLP